MLVLLLFKKVVIAEILIVCSNMYGCMDVRVKMLLRGYLSTISVTICIDVPLPLVPIPSPLLHKHLFI